MTDHFDPSEQETQELLPKTKSDMSDYTEDTMADPEGVAKRITKADVDLPDFFYKRYDLDDFGRPTFKVSHVNEIMKVFDAKVNTPMAFNSDNAEKELEYFDQQCNSIIEGCLPLLEVDAPATGISMLQLTTRTWAEFVSVVYEYKDSMVGLSNEEIPDWLVEREEKMAQLGRKARLLSQAVSAMDNKFGLSSTSLNRDRVQTEVERRLQRLAEWNFNKHANTTGKVVRELNAQAVDHMNSIADSV
tara:strand:+ start:411 stop:1148 length:738 start_codon:yes stop_codon:yes gene_type:complete